MATTWSQWATQQHQAQSVNMSYQQRTWAPQQPTYTRNATTYATQQEMEMMMPDQITQRAVAMQTDTTQALRRCVAVSIACSKPCCQRSDAGKLVLIQHAETC
jgi:hypothetical protein